MANKLFTTVDTNNLLNFEKNFNTTQLYINFENNFKNSVILRDQANNEYWSLHVRIIMSFVFVFLSFVGIIGNLLVITVVHRVPGMITPTNCYLVSLALSDCMFFIAAAPTELSYLHVASSRYIFGSVGCAVFSYLPYLAINTSSMSITAFTIERFIGICYPLRARYICTVKRAKIITSFIWFFGIFYNSPWLYLATLKTNSKVEVCSFKLARENWTYKVMFIVDFAAFYFIPMILYIFIYTKIIYTLSKNSMKNNIDNQHICISTTPPKYCSSVPLITSNTRQTALYGNDYRKNLTKNKIQVIKMLAVVVFIFAVLWLPYRAMVMYNSFATNSKWDSDWYIFVAKTLIFLNCSINPILYNLMSIRFRNAFKQLFNRKNY